MNPSATPEPLDLERHATNLGMVAVFRGLLAIAFGLIALANPRATATALVIVFAVWAFVDAGFAIGAAVRRGRVGLRWGWAAFEALVGIVAGIVALAYPAITLVVLVAIVAVRALLLGVSLIGGAIAWKRMPSRWLTVVAGIVSIAFGILLLWHPVVGALALVWTTGIYAVVFGLTSDILGFELLGLGRRLERGPTGHGPAYGQ